MAYLHSIATTRRRLATLTLAALILSTVAGSTLTSRGDAQQTRPQQSTVTREVTVTWPGGRRAPADFAALVRTMPADSLRIDVGRNPPRGGTPAGIIVIRDGDGTIIVCIGNRAACTLLILEEMRRKVPK
ncbi:MAG TPA: hypothetical protein VFJ82_12025 [Longimicrobium sp.]|nr:hypothetical protein [Longimicrobium sp.]